MTKTIRNAITRSRNSAEICPEEVLATDAKISAFGRHVRTAQSKLRIEQIDAALGSQDRAAIRRDGVLSATDHEFDVRIVKFMDVLNVGQDAFRNAFGAGTSERITRSPVFAFLADEQEDAMIGDSGALLEMQRPVMGDVLRGTGPLAPETVDVLLQMREREVRVVNALSAPAQPVSVDDLSAGRIGSMAVMAVWTAHVVSAIAEELREQGARIDDAMAPSADEVRGLVGYVEAHAAEVMREFELEGDEMTVGPAT